MDIYESRLSRSGMLNEQIAGELFDILPEDGPIVMIIGKDGNYQLSDPERFSKLNISEPFLKGVCSKVDDGAEPVITGINDFGIVASQLSTVETNCGYVIIALPQYSCESTLTNFGLIEMLLNQIELIANLVEKNGQGRELQIRQLGIYSQSSMASS